MPKLIYKYQIKIQRVQEIEMPESCNPLCFQLQNEIPTMWAEVDPDTIIKKHEFFLIGTGQQLPAKHGILNYIGTIQKDGYVWHLYYNMYFDQG